MWTVSFERFQKSIVDSERLPLVPYQSETLYYAPSRFYSVTRLSDKHYFHTRILTLLSPLATVLWCALKHWDGTGFAPQTWRTH
jgi:hypothetical protein